MASDSGKKQVSAYGAGRVLCKIMWYLGWLSLIIGVLAFLSLAGSESLSSAGVEIHKSNAETLGIICASSGFSLLVLSQVFQAIFNIADRGRDI